MQRWIMFFPIIFALIGCAAAPAPTATPPPTPTEAPAFRVGLVADIGGMDDAGYNASSLAGAQGAAQRLGLEFDAVVAESGDDYEPLIRSYAEQGYDVVVTVGFAMSEIMPQIAPEYPDVHFIGVDQNQTEPQPNITGIIFPEDQAGYLAGYLAASMSETGIISGVYGPDMVPAIQRFATGYENGARAANPDITVIATFYPGGVEGFNDIAWGESTAEAQMAEGADVVFTAAGDTGNGALIAVANTVDEANALYCIGVDTDQWMTLIPARRCLISSAVKAIPVALDEVIRQAAEGTPPSGNYFGPVGLAPFHDFEETVPADLQAELETLADQLTSGEVSTGYTGG